MSAYKTAFIRLGEAEYKRLREAEEQLRLNMLLRSDSKNDQHDQSIYENMMGMKKQNDRNFQNLVVNLEGEINRIENEAASWVNNQATRLQSEFIRSRNDVQKQAADQIEEMVVQANLQIQQKENAFNQFWLAQEERISTFENRWQEYETLALNWIHNDLEVLDFIYETYLVDALTANHLEIQRQYLNHVIQQYNNGFFDIAASAGFQIFIALSNTRFQLEVDRAVQGIQYQNLLEKASTLEIAIHESETVHAMDAEGNELPELINVDYWVEGKYREFANYAESFMQRLRSDEAIDLMTILDYERQVNQFNNQLIDLVTQARLVVLASQLRFNVAQIVVQALEEQGFFLEQANYEKGDYRESFVAKTCNFAGNEVLISIDPDPGLDEGGKLNIQSLDANQITEHELLQRNYEIFSAIKDNGIEVGNIQELKQMADGNFAAKNRKTNTLRENLESLEEKINHGRY
jgi:hypothetical protein